MINFLCCTAKILLDIYGAVQLSRDTAAVAKGAVAGFMFHSNQTKGKIMFTNVEDFQKFGKTQFEAMTAATTTVSKGLQEIATESSEYSKKSIAASSAVMEKLLGAKTVETAIQIQTDFAKSAYEGFVAQATRINELYSKVAKEAFKPVEAVMAKTKA